MVTAVGSKGMSGGPIVNICGEVIGILHGGSSLTNLERFEGGWLLFEHLDQLLPQLDRLGSFHDTVNPSLCKG